MNFLPCVGGVLKIKEKKSSLQKNGRKSFIS
jgi:hypothetical protein